MSQWDQLFNRWVDLDEIDGVLARRIEGRVHEPRGWNDLFDLMDSVLAERLAAVRISAPGVLWAWWERSGGLTSTGLEPRAAPRRIPRAHWRTTQSDG